MICGTLSSRIVLDVGPGAGRYAAVTCAHSVSLRDLQRHTRSGVEVVCDNVGSRKPYILPLPGRSKPCYRERGKASMGLGQAYNVYCVTLFLLFAMCSAKPAQGSSGFPAKYLPTLALPSRYAVSCLAADCHRLTSYLPSSFNDSTAPASNIGAPLRPENTDWLHVRIAYDRSFKAAKGGELVMSLAATIYYAWVDTANEPIGTPKRVRRIPFLNFQYIIRPSAAREAVLNPFKLGIAYCWIIDSLLKQQDWPGCINADLSDNNDRSIAILQVANVPQDSGAPPKAAADKALEKVLFANESYSTRTRRNHNGNGPGLALAIPIEIERRWFTCLYSMLLFIVAKPTTSRVASELPPFPFSTDVKTYHFTCDPEDPTNKDRIDVYISSASRDARNGLTWDALAKTLLLFGTRIADDGDWESEQLVVHQDVVTAALGISLDHASGASDEA